jgi:predicted RNA binding protein YcfA (HicA-like mRNA interferase family)
MSNLPIISGENTIKKLEKIGYRKVRQKGSHVRLRSINKTNRAITIPLHKELKTGLLHQIIKDAELSVEEFINL